MKIGNREFDMENDYCIMGILNVTPDSFSDGGCYRTIDDVLFRVEQMISEGCDILDIGGESTRPGHIKITEDEELERICPVIESVRRNFDVPISLDTYKTRVADAGILAGADMINDIWGFKWNIIHANTKEDFCEDNIADVVAKHGVAVCLMHNRGQASYDDLFSDMKRDLQESLDIAKQAGILEQKILLDVGIGFAKSQQQNLQVLQGLDVFQDMGYPLLLGASRKSVIGNVLKLPTNERLEGTLAITVLGAMKGVRVFRVHDVKENRRVLDMVRAINNC